MALTISGLPRHSLGMILVALWGIWHIVAGLITAFIFTRRKLPGDDPALAG